ncbi:MAG: hypothetical protein WBV73_01600 [Phormidium sp.]
MSSSIHRKDISFNSRIEQPPLFTPIGDITSSAGYAISGLNRVNDNQNQATMSQLAKQVLEDPLLLRQLSDRIYELMQTDLRLQRERSRNYGRRY